jgi:TetR/AcrR family transcriptional regulator, tetracycline repressor protein
VAALSATKSGSSACGSRRGRPRRGDPALTRDQILGVAAVLLEEVGPEQLTMRRIAVDLGVDPMSLYNHIENKDGLLDGLAQRFLETLSIPAPVGDLRADIINFTNVFRSAASRQPRAATVLLTRQLGSMTGLAATDAALGILRSAGFSVEEAVHSFRVAFAFLVGTILREVSVGPGFSGQNLGGLHERESELSVVGLPNAAEAAHLLAVCDHDQDFLFGVNMLISGLEILRALSNSSASSDRTRA